MKRGILWIASCLAIALTLLIAKTNNDSAASGLGVKQPAIAEPVPMPTSLHRARFLIQPADQMETGQEVTLSELIRVFNEPKQVALLQARFAYKGWNEQTRLKIAVLKYQLATNGEILAAPLGWNWKNVAMVSMGDCFCCDAGCNTVWEGEGSREKPPPPPPPDSCAGCP